MEDLINNETYLGEKREVCSFSHHTTVDVPYMRMVLKLLRLQCLAQDMAHGQCTMTSRQERKVCMGKN